MRFQTLAWGDHFEAVVGPAAMTLDAFRRQFPALERYVWLNASASAPLARPVAAAVRAFVDDAEAHGDLGYPRWELARETLRTQLAHLVNAAPEQVGLCASTSHAMGIVARQLQARGVREVVTLEGEFPSTTVPLLQAGLTLRVVPKGSDGGFSLDAIEGACTPATGAIACSAVQFASGFLVDLEGLASLASARRCLLAVNGAQALGQLPLDFAALGLDYLCAPGHKWLCGGWGVGVLVTKGPLVPEALPGAGWLSLPPAQVWNGLHGARLTPGPAATVALGVALRPEAAVVEAGIPPFAAHAGLSAALTMLDSVGLPAIRAQVLVVQRALRTLLRSRGFTPTSPDDERHLSGICVVKVQGPPDAAVRALVEQQVVTTARGGGVRFATHGFNDLGDVARLGDALTRSGVKPG